MTHILKNLVFFFKNFQYFEIWRNISYSQWADEYPTWNK